MSVRLELDLGSIGRVTVEGDDPREIIKGLGFWQSLPTTCPLCESPTRLVYDRVKSTKAETFGKEYDYYRLRCTGEATGEQHEVSLGQYQDGSGLFYPESKEWAPRPARVDEHDAPEPRREEPTQRQAQARPVRVERPLSVDDFAEPVKPEPATIGKARAAAMSKALSGLGIGRKEHERFASEATGRKVTDLADLTDDEARMVWAEAKSMEAA